MTGFTILSYWSRGIDSFAQHNASKFANVPRSGQVYLKQMIFYRSYGRFG